MKLAHRKMRIFVRKNKSGKFSKTLKMDKLVLKDTHNPKLNILECDNHKPGKVAAEGERRGALRCFRA